MIKPAMVRMFRLTRLNRFTSIASKVFVILAVFVLGLAFGNGWLRVSFWSVSARSDNAALPTQLDYSSVTQVYDALKQNYDGRLSVTQLLNGLKAGLAESTKDPYTQYFTAAQAQDFMNELNNSYSGIGVDLGKDANGNLIIISPISGFPAYKAGLQAQDIIATINGQSTSGMSLDEASNAIRGPQNSQVTLGIVRHESQTLSFTITRESIHLPSVESKIMPGNIGYIKISTFADDTSQLIAQVAEQFRQASAKGVVLDLRSNPGGLVDAAINVSSLWLPSGKVVVHEKGTIGNVTYTATGNDILNGTPTVVLINEGSASASEITAAALHDNGAAWIIGVKSFGKGVVQQPFSFSDGSELKVTVASWYRPNGQNINKVGITPDQVIPDGSIAANSDPQLSAASTYLMSR